MVPPDAQARPVPVHREQMSIVTVGPADPGKSTVVGPPPADPPAVLLSVATG